MWQKSHKHFLFIVDCQPLCNVICGKSPLESPDSENTCHRTTENIKALFFLGWAPPRRWEDPVFWKPREYNRIADYLVSATMDLKTSWSRQLNDIPADGCNIICHSDGGTRIGMCSAAAYIVEARVERDGVSTTIVLAMGGIYMDNPVSSFDVEAIALEECSSCARRLIELDS